MPESKKEDIIFGFQHDKGRKEDLTLDVDVKNKCRIIVATSELMGVGFTLHRAHRVVLMEPDWTTAAEEQVYARIHRIGGLNQITWARRLITKDDTQEQEVIQRQTARNLATELVFNPDTEVPEGGDLNREVTTFPPNNSPPVPSSSEASPPKPPAKQKKAGTGTANPKANPKKLTAAEQEKARKAAEAEKKKKREKETKATKRAADKEIEHHSASKKPPKKAAPAKTKPKPKTQRKKAQQQPRYSPGDDFDY